MAYIRPKQEERTGYQESRPFAPSIDLGCDFVMVYGTDETMPDRIRQYADAGYQVHLMTGIAWGNYQDYLDGAWDGNSHWDEAQRERDGREVIHGPKVPYISPSISFADYLTQRLKKAVDCGVQAIHLEEPEFWDRSGYSQAFRREYELRYREPFHPQHTDADAHWRCARLKAELYARTLERVSGAVKEYAKARYGRSLRFYVPTHSLLNYCQWKIISPEASLIGLSTVDGYIAQVWTGTSRVANVYEGVYRERIFETAFLEYGVMQELARGTGRRMWFLHDPIEDNPSFTWDDYRRGYEQTAVASLLHPRVWHYEICPWPRRVFEGRYPRIQPNIGKKDETSFAAADAKPIPDSYRTFLSGMFQLFGDMEQPEWAFDGEAASFGVFMSDTCLYQRTYPDTVPVADGFEEKLYGAIIRDSAAVSPAEAEEKKKRAALLMAEIEADESKLNAFIASAAFPHFYGLSLPLLKYGLPVRPIQLDNVRRFAGYLKDIRFAALSYEYMKPVSPDINLSLAEWVRSGGRLICVGDGKDPFHGLRSWWRDAGYDHPMQHLFEIMGLPREPEKDEYRFGEGRVVLFRQTPAKICLKKASADAWRETVRAVLRDGGAKWTYENHILLRRGPYLICHVMDESVHAEPKVLNGRFVDLMADGYPVIHQKTVEPGGSALLYDMNAHGKKGFAVIASAARVLEAQESGNGLRIRAHAADGVLVYLRFRIPFIPIEAQAEDEEKRAVPLTWEYDAETQTALLSWRSAGREIIVDAAGRP